jgi:carbamoyltransferase
VHQFGQATGVPVTLNTSFNLRGEPIVNTPRDAFNCFRNSDIDLLSLGSYVVRKPFK